MALTTVDRVLAWANPPDFADDRQEELSRCVVAASSICSRYTGRRMVRATRTRVLDGCEATGRLMDTLRLPLGDRPVLYLPTDNPAHAITITEDGLSLTVGPDESTTPDVFLVGVNEDEACQIVRNGCGWSSCSRRNVVVTYDSGWSID